MSNAPKLLDDTADMEDAMCDVADAIEKRRQALSRYRESDVGEVRHRDSLRPSL